MADVDMYSDDEYDFDNGDEVASDDDDFTMEENVVPATKSKKTAAKKKTAAAPKKKAKALGDASNNAGMDADEDDDDSVAMTKTSKGKKTIEETYQKKTQLEHILLRPDTYIGSTEPLTQPMYVLDTETKKIVEKEVTFTPGFYKIFDEIVVNAADNKQRDPNMNELLIEIKPEENYVSVQNNGNGIPVQLHKKEGCYVPTLIFGHLLTGSNFSDDDKKTTGGRNGYGAKLCNIFSHTFTVECLDSTNEKKFRQTFRNNMSIAEEPIITKITKTEKKKGDYTKISFEPDLARFKMDYFDEDAVALLSKRAYDIAGSMANSKGKKLGVFLNGEQLPIKDFKDYLKTYTDMEAPVAYEKVGCWEIGVAPSNDNGFQQISFVNSICTSKGGGHVTYITDQLTAHLVKTVKKKNKGGTEVKPAQLKTHLAVFVNCLVENPTFDSQTKENCTTKKGKFGSECTISEKFLKQVDKSAIVDNIISFVRFKQGEAMKKKSGTKKLKLTGIAKLDDANNAGGAKSKDCTLIITEGDSAKSLAMSGLSVVGRDYYGVFPLRGKPLNVRDAKQTEINKNEELQNIVKILGLKFGTKYDGENIKTLRYGKLMIMADQDQDGSHIKGLVINMIHHYWPGLLDVPGFLRQFITPIVKATKGKQSKVFFTLPEYEGWSKSPAAKGYTVKYYKGLGTSTAEEAKEYFSNLYQHEIEFKEISKDIVPAITPIPSEDADEDEDAVQPEMATSGSDLIDMAFQKDRVADRKTWLNRVTDNVFLDYKAAQKNGGVKYSEFINQELILFSKSDNMRSIPHFVDGFKPSQRKVLFACLKKNLKREMKVAQLAGYIGEKSAYHHGEQSLHGTIVGMAQNFCGSNNLNLLTPSGQFGTRRMGGKDAASPRYIFTKLEPIARAIFHPDDDDILNYLEDDGISIEPDFYMPVIPLVLVNGSDGIGTGWSSKVPNYCPREIVASLRKMIKGEEAGVLHPKYYGFTGPIIQKDASSYAVEGKIERVDDKTLIISELPIKKWTQDFKVYLESMLVANGKKQEPELKDFKENHTDTTVSFTITAEPSQIDEFEKSKNGLLGYFKLTTSIATSNMTLFDTEGKIKQFDNANQILSSFYDIRLEYYGKRKALMIERMSREKRILSNKARFVEEVCSGELVVSNRKRKELLAELQERGYELFPKDPKKTSVDEEEEEPEEETDDTTSDAELGKGYEYLLGMKIWSLTKEKADKLRQELADKTEELANLEATEPSQLWLNDLDAVEQALDERDVVMKENAEIESKARNKAAANRGRGNKKATARKKAPAKKKKTTDWDSDMEDGESDGFSADDDSDVEMIVKKPVVKPVVKPTVKPAFKPATKRKPAAKLTAKKPVATIKKSADPVIAKKAVNIDSDDESDEEMEDLASRLGKLASPSKAKAGIKRKESPVEELIDSDLEEDTASPPDKKKVTTEKKKKTTNKKANKKAAPSTKPKKATSIEADFESEADSDSDSGDDFPTPPPRAKSGRARKATTKVPVYNLDDSEDDDGSDFSFDG